MIMIILKNKKILFTFKRWTKTSQYSAKKKYMSQHVYYWVRRSFKISNNLLNKTAYAVSHLKCIASEMKSAFDFMACHEISHTTDTHHCSGIYLEQRMVFCWLLVTKNILHSLKNGRLSSLLLFNMQMIVGLIGKKKRYTMTHDHRCRWNNRCGPKYPYKNCILYASTCSMLSKQKVQYVLVVANSSKKNKNKNKYICKQIFLRYVALW